MKAPPILLLLLAWPLVCLPTAQGQDFLDQMDRALSLGTGDGGLRADLSVLADLETYVAETPPPGMLFEDDTVFVNPRLALFLDVQWTDYFSAHTQMRVDRGFDPGAAPDGDVRLDEYYVRLNPLGDDRLSLQAGKFATVFGNWTPRHLSWDNPFITAPLPYEDVLGITDQSAPPSKGAFLNRRNLADKKREWLPLIWGPSYASGASISGRIDGFEYALEIKNASLSSRPSGWDLTRVDLGEPTVSARLGARPAPEWAFGASFSQGPYLLDDSAHTLPRGTSPGDFDQTTFGLDAAFQHHHWQLWSEVMYSEFEVPNVGDAGAVMYYLEAKYKITSQLWAALRWNQSFFGDVPDGRGGEMAWERDGWRMDLALGYRFTRHLQAKLQYSYGDKSGADVEGDHLLATQLTVRF